MQPHWPAPAKGDNQQQTGFAVTEQLLSLPERPTALFVSNNLMAVGAIRAIHARGRPRIPQDVAIVGFDDTPSHGQRCAEPAAFGREPADLRARADGHLTYYCEG